MESAKVYFSDLRTDEISTLEKLRRLMKAAGFEQIDFKDKYVAVKLHFGEPGNMAYGDGRTRTRGYAVPPG